MKKIIFTILVFCSFSITKASSSTKITKKTTESELLKTIKSKAVVVNPLLPAANPTVSASRVLSLFSNTYPNAPVTSWRSFGAGSNLTDLQISGNDTKQYDSLGFFGVDLTTPVDATLSNVFHIDIWTPDVTEFKIKFVDLGANGLFGGGDDVEHELTLTLGTFGWNNIDIPMSDFTGLVTKGHIKQVIIAGTSGGTIFLDNLYFSFDKPRFPAPSPTVSTAASLSLFSNTYTNMPMSSWRAFGAGSNLTDFQIAGNDIKKYDAIGFWGAELASPLDASSATSFRFDLWTIDRIAFKVKLVDLGPNGNFGGGDDVEHEVSRTPVVEGWNSFNIPMSEFTNLTTKGHIKLLIFSSDLAGSTVFLDNIYFTITPPSMAPRPTRPLYQVLSVYSDTYSSLTGIDWNPNFGQSTTLTDILIQGNRTKRYTNLNYQGVVFSSPVNASSMTNLHLDIFTTNSTSFDVFLGSGPEQKVTLTPTQSGWNSFDIPLAQYTAIDKANISLMKFEAAPFGTSTVYIDNIYFWNSGLTQLRPMQCGKTLTSLNPAIQASPIIGATEYTFEVTRIDNNVVNTIVTPNYFFFPATLITNGLVFGRSYSIRVQVRVGGVLQAFGNACIVTAPAEPLSGTLTKIRPMQCGRTMNFITDAIQASPVHLAVRYEFEVSNGVTTLVIPSNTFWFRLSQFPGGGVLNTAYTIRVRSSNGPSPAAFTSWGDPCVVSTPIARLSEEANDVFEVKSFPNPFASHFNLDIESSSDAQVEMKVYDMIGRQLEVRKASVSELSVQEIGHNYPAGVYNVVVSQGEKVKSVRMVKR